MNGLKPPQPEPAGLVSHVLDVTTGGVPQGDISPTLPFVVDGSMSMAMKATQSSISASALMGV